MGEGDEVEAVLAKDDEVVGGLREREFACSVGWDRRVSRGVEAEEYGQRKVWNAMGWSYSHLYESMQSGVPRILSGSRVPLKCNVRNG
jgi:hypothetical protein